MILDLPHFVQAEKPYWGEFQAVLQGIETEPEFEREIPPLARRQPVVVNAMRRGAMRELLTGMPRKSLDNLYEVPSGPLERIRVRDRIKAEVTAEYLDVKMRQVL